MTTGLAYVVRDLALMHFHCIDSINTAMRPPWEQKQYFIKYRKLFHFPILEIRKNGNIDQSQFELIPKPAQPYHG